MRKLSRVLKVYKAFSRLPTLENGVRPGHHKASGGKFLGENYLNSDKFSDVTFLVEGRRVRAHRIALLAASQRAVEILGVERDEVKVEGVSHATWQEVLRFIYTGSCVVTEESDAQELLLQAERLQLEGLKHACETYLISTIDEGVSTIDEGASSASAAPPPKRMKVPRRK